MFSFTFAISTSTEIWVASGDSASRKLPNCMKRTVGVLSAFWASTCGGACKAYEASVERLHIFFDVADSI